MSYCSLVGKFRLGWDAQRNMQVSSISWILTAHTEHWKISTRSHFIFWLPITSCYRGKLSSQGSTSWPLSLLCLSVRRMIVYFMLAIDRKLFLTVWRDSLLSSSYCNSQWTWLHARRGKMLIITISHITNIKELLAASVRRSEGYWWIHCYGSLWQGSELAALKKHSFKKKKKGRKWNRDYIKYVTQIRMMGGRFVFSNPWSFRQACLGK